MIVSDLKLGSGDYSIYKLDFLRYCIMVCAIKLLEIGTTLVIEIY